MKNYKIPTLLFFFTLLVNQLQSPHAQEANKHAIPEQDRIEDVFQDTKMMFIGEDLYTISIASRREEPLRRAPAAVTVLTEEDLKRFRTLSEALASIPGFFTDRNEIKSKIYLRGIPDSFLVMMDGVPFSNDTSTRDYPRGLELSLDYLEKIEIIRGPGSALWGADAFSGIVNLVTKKGKDLKGTEVSTEVGTFNTQRYKLVSGYNTRDLDFLFSANYTASDDFEHNPARQYLYLPKIHERKRDYYDEFYGKVRYKDYLEISGRVSKYKNFFSVPRFHYNGEEYTPFSFFQITLKKDVGSFSSLLFNAYLEHFKNLQEFDLFTSRNKNWQYGWEGKYDFNLFKKHFLTLGVSLRYNDGSSTKARLKLLDTPITTTIRSFDTHLLSLYFQEKYKITDTLELTAGVRYDKHDEYRRTISPRLGLSYSFLNGFNLKLLYGRAFRTPALYVLLEEGGLKTEKIECYEVEVGYRYGEVFTLNGNFFYNKLKDIIEEVAFGTVRNRDRDHVKGIEFSGSYQPFSTLSLYASTMYLIKNRRTFEFEPPSFGVEYREEEEENIESTFISPRGTFNWGVTYRPLKYFTANLNFAYYTKRKLPRNQYYTRTGDVSPYLGVDCNLFLHHLLHERIEMSIKLRNVFDTEYHSRGKYSAIDGAGRGVFFSLHYKF